MQTISVETPKDRPPLFVPDGMKRLLLHCCCAPCSGEIIEALHASGAVFAVYYYNPNIYPREEYVRRKADNIRFAEKLGVPFADADYDPENWQTCVKGLEDEPERGARCTQCFSLRLERAALFAHENGFDALATSLGMSRWKNLEQVNACGQRAVAPYDGLRFWDNNWRKNGGADRRFVIARREGFYEQKYCGCVYSLRDANARQDKKTLRENKKDNS
ncbi:MAG: epoxyqueuosine reductase QueH [Alphaproteobacteria bacterium]|nr:epoxyqueuosine reductase QueH [Alphaproteobacteria bacterium]